MRVWIYGRNAQEICALLAHCVGNADTVIGFSIPNDTMRVFPQGGLIQPIQAAIRGELDQLLLPDCALLGSSTEQIRELEAIFRSYQVAVKSACNCGSSSS